MRYRQLSREERYIISHLRKQGCCPAEIARQTGRHRSTIMREFKRNSDRHSVYRPSKAQEMTNGRRSRSRRNSQFSAGDYELVDCYIRKQWSPEQVAGRLKREGKLSISHETIYKYIWTNKANGGWLWTHLRGSRKKRRKRYGAYDSRGQLAEKRHISERPPEVEGRRAVGHWEADTVRGTKDKDCILTMVERKTGYVEIGKLPNRTKAQTKKRMVWMINKQPRDVKTITCDNGTEFHSYPAIEKKTDALFYFATPYHSWERGTNENTNGLIRQYLPKTKSMKGLNQWDCNRIANKLNTRPRKRLNFKTPQECYDQQNE
jgi:IS30 family transposase